MQPFKLPAEAINALREADRELHDILPELDKADQCGIECREYRRVVQEQREQISKLLQNYGQ